MNFKLVLISCLLFSACSDANSINKLTKELEGECTTSGQDSKQCEILRLENYTLDEKEGTMGYLYLFGSQAVKPNYNKAFYWLSKSAKSNNPEAYNALGILYGFGLGKTKNFHEAEKCFILAIKYGEKFEAKVNLAELYRGSPEFGIPLNFEKSKAWYLLAVSENPSRAYEGLSKLYLTQNNYKEVYNYASKAAGLGNQESQYNLGVLYEKGIYVKEDKKQAEYWYTQAAAQGHVNAINNLRVLKKE